MIFQRFNANGVFLNSSIQAAGSVYRTINVRKTEDVNPHRGRYFKTICLAGVIFGEPGERQ
jgi:hypothetical protein